MDLTSIQQSNRIEAKLDRIEHQMGRLDTQVANLREDVAALVPKVDHIDDAVGNIPRAFDALQSRITHVERDHATTVEIVAATRGAPRSSPVVPAAVGASAAGLAFVVERLLHAIL